VGIDAERLAVVPLTGGGRASDPALTGAKTANLARAHAAGLPVLPGFAIVPLARAPGLVGGEEPLRRAWRELAEAHPVLVVRSSATGEDAGGSSMAGRFASVLGVRGWEEFTTAVRTVIDSAGRVPDAERSGGGDGEGGDGGMAVLVQPMLDAVTGGVMFGADPVAGRADRILVGAVRGGPDRLVGGTTQGVRYQLTRHGRLVHAEPPEPRRSRVLSRRRLIRLARLARQTDRTFGGPQDVEFGFDERDRLWLFQARPITAMAVHAPRGAPLLGPGPVAETFPEVLQPLEEDLWLVPMADGLTRALGIGGGAPRRRLRARPPVVSVGGRAAADLRLLGAVPSAHPVIDFFNPVPGARRTSAAWRVGRLRTALPLLALDLMAEVDRELSGLPPPGSLLGGQLLAALSWGRTVLSSLHAQESLVGVLLGQGTAGDGTAAGEALAVLAERRAQGWDTDTDTAGLIARHPVLLVLLPPSLSGGCELPERTGATGAPRGVAALSTREGLRLRIRWVQELQARLVLEFAARLTAAGHADVPARLSAMRWEELAAALEGAGPPPGLAGRAPRPQTPPLPAAFRLAADGSPVAEPVGRGAAAGGGGQGGGGGYGTGTAWHGSGERPGRAVLVVRVLDPRLAPELPGLAGLVAGTGSVLSHLAVLAREYRVPTAVGVAGALERFPPGTELSVDGATGAVEVTEPEAAGAA
jgi:rifampicin phosphotransferase